jgi:hypothetical protein
MRTAAELPRTATSVPGDSSRLTPVRSMFDVR